MEVTRFESFACSHITRPSRRTLLGIGAAGGLATVFNASDVEAKKKRKKRK